MSFAIFYSRNSSYLHIPCFIQQLSSIKICDAMALNSGCLRFSLHIHRARKHSWSTGNEIHSHNSLSPVSGKLSCALWGFPSPAWCQYQPYKRREKTKTDKSSWLKIFTLQNTGNTIPGPINALFDSTKKLLCSFGCWNTTLDQFALVSGAG